MASIASTVCVDYVSFFSEFFCSFFCVRVRVCLTIYGVDFEPYDWF